MTDLPTTTRDDPTAGLDRGAPATLAGLRAWNALARAVKDGMHLGSTPLLVVTAERHGFSPEGERIWAELQRELVTLSDASRQVVVPGSHHNGVAAHPEHARVTADAVRAFLEAL